MPSVTIDYDEFETIKSARKKAETELEQLKAKMLEATLDNTDGLLRGAYALVRGALTVTAYSMGMIGVQAKSWPTMALRQIADGIETIIDATPQERELALEIRHFARDAEAFSEHVARRAVIDEADRIEKQRVVDVANAALQASIAAARVSVKDLDDDFDVGNAPK